MKRLGIISSIVAGTVHLINILLQKMMQLVCMEYSNYFMFLNACKKCVFINVQVLFTAIFNFSPLLTPIDLSLLIWSIPYNRAVNIHCYFN